METGIEMDRKTNDTFFFLISTVSNDSGGKVKQVSCSF